MQRERLCVFLVVVIATQRGGPVVPYRRRPCESDIKHEGRNNVAATCAWRFEQHRPCGMLHAEMTVTALQMTHILFLLQCGIMRKVGCNFKAATTN